MHRLTSGAALIRDRTKAQECFEALNAGFGREVKGGGHVDGDCGRSVHRHKVEHSALVRRRFDVCVTVASALLQLSPVCAHLTATARALTTRLQTDYTSAQYTVCVQHGSRCHGHAGV